MLHITGGDSREIDIFKATYNTFTNPKSGVSSHYVIRRSGDVYKFVDDKYASWHAGLVYRPKWSLLKFKNGKPVSPNLYTVGIEFVCGIDQELTDKQYKVGKELIKRLCEKHGIVPDKDHIIPHGFISAYRQMSVEKIDINRLIAQEDVVFSAMRHISSGLLDFKEGLGKIKQALEILTKHKDEG